MTAMTTNKRSTAPRHLEDFTVGDRVESGAFTLTRELIRSFAEQYDPQPMHLDDVAARETVFGTVVGSGWQTLAVTMRLMVDARLLGGTPIVGAEFKNTRFHAPVRPGDTLWASAEVTAIQVSRSRPDRGFMDMQVTTKNTADVVLVTQSWRLVVPTRPEDAAHCD